jgi:ADP-L-glycero-D-manno-heptose 6-epimerase
MPGLADTLVTMFIVTGGAGFIGSAFVRTLNSHGIRDILVVDDLGSSQKWKNLVKKSFREYVHKHRFLDLVTNNNLPSGIDGIIHLGACSSTTEQDVDYLVENNFAYTRTLARFAIDRGIRFVYASSAATYGDGASGYDDDVQALSSLRPLNPYGFSKHLFDLWARDNNALDSIVGLKFFNVYGPNEYYKGEMSSVVWKAFNKIRQTGSFHLFKSYRPEYGDGEQQRDFVYVKDCCDVMWWLLNNRSANGIFNLGTGQARSWNDLVASVFAAMNRAPKIEYIEMPESLRNQYQYFTEAKMDRLSSSGYHLPFRSLEDGIKDYVTQHLVCSDPHF